MAKLSKDTIESISDFLSRKNILLVLLYLLVGLNLLLAIYYPKEYALDFKFSYSPEEAYLALSQLDSGKREAYFHAILLLDMPYPVIYSSFFWGISYRLWKKKWVAVPAIITCGADFLENLSLIQLLHNFPGLLKGVVVLASISTTVKWIFVSVNFLVIIIGLFHQYLRARYLKQQLK